MNTFVFLLMLVIFGGLALILALDIAAMVLLRKGKPRLALRLLLFIPKPITSMDYRPTFLLGEAYFANGRYKEAAEQFSRATQLSERNLEPYFALADSYNKNGEKKRAEEVLQGLLALTPLEDRESRQDIQEELGKLSSPN